MTNRDWATTDELKSLIREALSLGADEWVVSSESRTRAFLETDRGLQGLTLQRYYV